MTLPELLTLGRQQDCSDLHLSVGEPPVYRRNGSLLRLQRETPFDAEGLHALVRAMIPSNLVPDFDKGQDVDFCLVMEGGFRQRVNVFWQQGTCAVALRFLHDTIPTLDQLRLPPILGEMSLLPRGLILVTGPTGSGKSTSLAAMVDNINKNKRCHIITVEDPVEYMYNPALSLIHQREVGTDVPSFADALRSALREDPDVILVGEMRDYETIAAALTAAETGHLVLSTLHTTGAATTAQRIIDVFPPHQQQQVRVQLAGALRGVVTQQLVPKADGSGRVAALEILRSTDAVANMIRENKCHQINSVLQTGAKMGMQSMDAALGQLVRGGLITLDAAQERCMDKENLRRYIQGQ